MTVTVRLFAVARQRAGAPEVLVELPDPATVADLKRAVAGQHPALAPLLPGMMVAVSAEYAGEDRRIGPDDEVALIPPVSGG
ncbi:MoaD/ThiS family protein [Tautonia sociabilis]|uniref:Molybdopterin synthase sulfur carrier subunit n=1 Tax=Tautonia sociabilis TaxID=2080755 RepID=A0A432MD49_9BACT|nr:MoaD/ThiS family protein [Tautonia sociabilis]RUL81420.1 MoaD/ThiS family protein [Tautonia sociabilis]